ncbi:phosphotransferase family protein [Leifsonia bigeumensis]|uniref:Phosphotransferase family protein n=1 Tax=Leifsonella bigeumensis TaxID=433643 RepID=A0ABP7F8I4_9MICO
MQHTPDGTEVVATRNEAMALAIPPLLVVDAVIEFLDAHGLGTGGLLWERIGDGQSNVTYRLERGREEFVLRRGPRPPISKSTHDMVREARIQRLLREEGIPVPEILAVCEDVSVLGVPFYVMSFLDGIVVTDAIPASLNEPHERRATSLAAVDTLAMLHDVDVTKGEISRLGRPDGYLRRQVERFSSLWSAYTQRDMPEVARIGTWLADNMPASQRASVVHGDFRAGNLMFAAGPPARVTAILDWEMATLGDPLADLGYFTATYAEPGSRVTPLELTSVTREPGYLTRQELIEEYHRRQPHLCLEPLPWYQALALWKAAIFCEDIYTRWLRGERPGDMFAPTLEAGVPALLERARAFAGGE